jgi:phosphotransferase system  glucose/maltose/N-acetylglucosamine-specific IIC component
MTTPSTQFLYFLENLDIYSPTLPHVITAVLIGILFMIVFRFFFEYLAGFFMLRDDRKNIENKKNTLSDLILMKDIQTELEQEIEQATLKATFQG